ncbi:hypothetical protein [Pedobacter rhodius]|uniref:Uncharacterized protein n=1 Tax=Pedobacter rhodius TaxID=3004098 RepID=A0ABT4L1L6_9SPHI|nr:hypothetical protein [Pedobacter sp. SJ11]MCZ4225086.1 hypothetical protein [Pedobacter sp. SJ11]
MRTHGKFFVAVCIVVSSCAKERTTETVDETKALKASITANQPQWNVAMTFVHPGITWNASDLAFMKSHRTTAPWKASYDLFAASSTASLTYTMQGPFAVVGREPNVNLSAYQNDMAAVLHQSIMWYMTNNATYANKAKQILLAWAGTHNTWSGSTSALAASDYGVQGVTGAEILRPTSGGLTAANVTVIENYFRNECTFIR